MPKTTHPLLLRIRQRQSAAKDGNLDAPLVRQWRLLRLLATEPEGVAIREFAEQAGTSLKTIRRDLVTLQKAGFDLEPTVGRHGRKAWRLKFEACFPQHDEATADGLQARARLLSEFSDRHTFCFRCQ